jgi:hypothetical protein
MNRALGMGLILGILSGCALPAERIHLKPLGEDTPPQTYADLLSRARIQASAATEAFFVNGWTDLEEYAKGLEQTSRFLSKATEIPAKHREKLPDEAAELEKEARQLREAAKNQNVQSTNEIMQRINLKVRALRAE